MMRLEEWKKNQLGMDFTYHVEVHDNSVLVVDSIAEEVGLIAWRPPSPHGGHKLLTPATWFEYEEVAQVLTEQGFHRTQAEVVRW